MDNYGNPPNVEEASPARIYDYMVGGTANYRVDREKAEAILRMDPTIRGQALRNREFLGRVVRTMAESGICQFLDLGSGLPTQQNVHQVAQEINSAARVVYVDNDESVRDHARALLSGNGQTEFVHADVRHPDLLQRPELELLDWSEPVGVLLVSVLHFVADADQPVELVRRLISRATPGSMLGISHVTQEGASQEVLEEIKRQYESAPVPLYLRSRQEIAEFFVGRPLLEPGLVDITEWRPTAADEPGGLRLLGGVAAIG